MVVTNSSHTRAMLSRLGLTLLISIGLVLGLYFAVLNQSSRAADSLLVRIHADGVETILPTDAATVGEVLDQAGVSLDRLDIVEPSLSAPVSEAFNINVYRARPVKVVDGQRQITITTALRSSHLVAEAAGLTVYPEDTFEETLVSDFVKEQFIGEKITITRAKAVDVRIDGKTLELRTHASTVGKLFEERGIVLEGDDYADVPTETRIDDGLQVIVTRVGHEVVVEEQEIPFSTRTIKNFDLWYGEEEVKEKGKPGQVNLSYNITRHNGQEVSRKLLSKTIVSEPEQRVIVKGMKPRPVYETNEQILAALRQCETGSNYTTNTGNGYYGAYQFLISTWDRIAARYRPSAVGVRPDKATPADQDYLVLKNASASAGGFESQHPGCYIKLSLPKFPF